MEHDRLLPDWRVHDVAGDPVSADERVEAALAQHRALIVYSTSLLACSCTVARHSDAPRFTEAEHVAHVAAALAPVLAEVRAEALREAADDYTNSVGATKARPHARQWLRDRADRIERGTA